MTTDWLTKCACITDPAAAAERRNEGYCPANCGGSGLLHPWAAVVLGDCPEENPLYADVKKNDIAFGIVRSLHHPNCPCQGTGNRYPQVWRQCPYRSFYDNGMYEDLEGLDDGVHRNEECGHCVNGQIPDISVAGLTCIVASLRDGGFLRFTEYLTKHVPGGGMNAIIWWMSLTEEQRIEALGKAIAEVG